MPTSLSPVEILVILVVALIVLGPDRLPKAGRQVGKALAEMRRWSRGIQNEMRDAFDSADEPPRVSSPPSKTDTTPSPPTGAPPPATTSDEASTPPAPRNGSGPADEPSRE